MRETRVLGDRGRRRTSRSIKSHEPAYRGMPKVEPAVPERGLSLERLVGLSQPGTLELSQGSQCLTVNKLNDLSDLCFSARREIGAADVDQREPRSLRPEQASLPK